MVSPLSSGSPPIAKSGRHPSQVLPQSLEEGCRTLPSADFARYSISVRSFGSTQIPLCKMRLVEG